jgi:hypothetical protein
LTRGRWSLDAGVGETRWGGGVAYDVTDSLDVGLYGTTPYGEFDFAPAVGVSYRF